MFAGKLDIDGWALFNSSVEALRGMSHSVIDAIMKVDLGTLCSITILLMGCTIHSKSFQGEIFHGC